MRACAALAVLLALGGAAGAASQDNPLTRMVPREDGRSACFTRSYDDLIFRLDRTDAAACHGMERALRAR